jgi:hypothetical protein
VKKKILSIILACCLCFSVFSTSAVAYSGLSTQGINSIQWATIRNILLSISRSNATVSWGCAIVGNSDVDSIDVDFTLYKLGSNGYDEVGSWTSHSDVTSLTDSGSVSGSSGTYKIIAIIIVTTDTGETEEITTQFIKSV